MSYDTANESIEWLEALDWIEDDESLDALLGEISSSEEDGEAACGENTA